MWLANRVKRIKPSPTLTIESLAKSLKAQGIDIISFGAGEPDFDTPDNIKEAAKKAIDAGYTKYCPVGGTPELKQAIINKFKKDNKIEYKQDEIIVSCGAKHAIFNLCQAVLNPGDEIIIPAPYWVSYIDIAYLAGAKTKIIKTSEEDGFKLKPEQLEKAINKKTKCLIINSPSNPTGATYTKDELIPIAEICAKKNILIISDEIYEKLVYEDLNFVSIASLSEKIKSITLVINGVSKSYAMTGWRIGYAAGPKDIIDAMHKIQSQSTSNPTSIALKAALEALTGDQKSIEIMRNNFEKRRDFIVDRLNKIDGIKCLKPEGAFYVFPNVKKLLRKTYNGTFISNTYELSNYLLKNANIALLPGEPFGAPGYLRISYATSMENIKKGLDRLENAIKNI